MILAAGEGSRLRALGIDLPKPMMPVEGKPLLAHTVEWLAGQGVRDFVVNLHHQAEVIRGYFGDGSRWGASIQYSYEETLLGTAGAVKAVQHFFDQTFLVWYGDNLCFLDVAALIAFHKANKAIATVALYSRSDPTPGGIAELSDQNVIRRFVEKPAPDNVFSNLVNAGIYVMEPGIFDCFQPGVPCDFGRNVFPALIASGARVIGYRLDTELYWIDTPDDYHRTVDMLSRKKAPD